MFSCGLCCFKDDPLRMTIVMNILWFINITTNELPVCLDRKDSPQAPATKIFICYCDLSLPSKTSRHALVFDDESNLVEFKRRRIIYLIFLSFPFAKLPPWRRLKRNGASPDKKSYETIYLCCCSFPFLLWSQFYFNKRKLEKIELKDFLFPMLQIVGFCWIVWLPCDNQERTSAKRFLFSIFLFSD